MIPWTLIIIGALCTIVGVLGIIALLLLPIADRFEIVFDKDKDIVQSRLDAKVGRIVREEQKRLTRDFVICIFAGVLMFFAGVYLGYAAKGEGFWPYRKLFANNIAEQEKWQVSDRFNEAGQYVAEDGKTYTYYVIIDGEKITFSGVKCAGLEELEVKLSEIRRENTIILYDRFAVSSIYHGVEDMLNKLGFDYEETQ